MSKSIMVKNEAYDLLASLKTSPRDSFTNVILRHVRKPAATCGELIDRLESMPPPEVDATMLKKMLAGRGRRAHRR